ncbi:unnamed protein product [Effrenium voratum]|nr:unnamed protein product [Effrenium voratum]
MSFVKEKEMVEDFQLFRVQKNFTGSSAFETEQLPQDTSTTMPSSSQKGTGQGGEPDKDPDDSSDDSNDDDEGDQPSDDLGAIDMYNMDGVFMVEASKSFGDRSFIQCYVKGSWKFRNLRFMLCGCWKINPLAFSFFNTRGDQLWDNLTFEENGLHHGGRVKVQLGGLRGGASSKRAKPDEPYEPSSVRELRQLVEENIKTLETYENPPQVITEVLEKTHLILTETETHPKEAVSRLIISLEKEKKALIASGVLSASSRAFGRSKFIAENGLPSIYKGLESLTRQEKLGTLTMTRAVQLAMASEFGEGYEVTLNVRYETVLF